MRIRSLPCLLLLALLAAPATVWAQPSDPVRSAPLVAAPADLVKAAAVAAEPPARIAAAVAPLARLAEARVGAADQLAALAAHNLSRRPPVRIGFARPLPVERRVRFSAELAGAPAGLHAGGAFARVGVGATVWGAAVEVTDSHRLRLHLSEVDLPAGTRMWVYGEAGAAVAFGPELAHEGELWTPSVYGPSIRLEVELPREALGAGGFGFVVDRIGEIFRLGADGAPLTGVVLPRAQDFSCLTDTNCVGTDVFPVIDQAEKAIAYIEFVDGVFLGACSGGLLNLADGSPPGLDPPFLTANHCFDTQAGAASLEAFWDHRTTTCDGPPPVLDGLPRSFGADLLATSVVTDFTLVDFHLPPPGDRVLLGWNAENPTWPSGTQLHRLSHPFVGEPLPLQYTRYSVKNQVDGLVLCGEPVPGQDTNDLTKFHHMVFSQGGSWQGSSGAPSMLGNGQVVGQLYAACGDPEDTDSACSTAYDELDGNFYTTFDFIAGFLGAGWLRTPEVPGFEFQVEITPAGSGPLVGRMEPDCIVETFCASGALAGRPEVFVKLIGPRPNGFLWVQISRFTPSQVTVLVRQVSTDQVNTYVLPAVPAASDDVSGLQDRTAFSP
jgi:lysyl endopeptidase